MKKTRFIFLALLAINSFAFAQIKLQLNNGETFVIEGAKQTYKDKYGATFYMKETNDTIYSYKYQSKVLEETRVPLAFFNKATVKNSGASVKFYDAKRFANVSHFVGFTCAKNGQEMSRDTNYFILIKYGNTSNNQASQISTTCQANIYFPMEQAKEAKTLLKTIEERIKNLK